MSDTIPASTSTSNTISINGQVSSRIDTSGDEDWFRVSFQAGVTYQIDLEGSPTNSGTLSDPYFRGVYNSSGLLISGTSDDDGGTSFNSQLEFTPRSAGIYYLSAGAFSSNTGSYVLSVTGESQDDDYGQTTTTAASASVGRTFTGNIEAAGDQDWFAIPFQSGNTYVIDLEGSPTNAGSLSDTYLYGIYDPRGVLISGTGDDDSGTGRNSSLEFTANSSGTYYVSAGAYSGNTGTYSISFSGTEQSDDYGTSISNAGSVGVGASTTGEIEEAGDQDWFAISLQAGTTYQFDLEGSVTNAGTLPDTYLRGVYDSSGSLIRGTTNDDGGSGVNSQLEFTAGSTGTYFIAAGAYGSNIGTYTLSTLSLASADDYGETAFSAGSVSIGGSTSAEIEESGDRDWFAISLQGGISYIIDLEGSPTSAGTLPDTKLSGIYNSSGSRVSNSSNDDGGTGLNSQLEFIAPTTGTYYISASAHGDNTGTYRVSVSDGIGPADDFGQTTSSAGTVSVGSSRTGEIELAEDQDWFAVSLQAGTTYTIDLEGSGSGGTLSDTYLRGIYNSRGSLLRGTTNDDGGSGLNSQLEYSPSSSGTYYIAAGGYGDNIGTYTLSISGDSVPPDDFGETTSTAGSVVLGSVRRGEIEEAGDQDWFGITLQAGTEYTIDLEGSPTSKGTLPDAFFRGIYNSSGSLINNTANDDGGTGHNSQLEFTPTSTGTYYLSAGAYGNNIGSYALTVTGASETDDYGQTISTAATASVGVAARGNIEVAGDQDWFAITLRSGGTYQIDLEGSPTDAGTLSDTYLRGIYDSNGTFINQGSDDDSGVGSNSSLEFLADTSGTYYIAAGAFGSNTGSYKLTVSGGTSDDSDDSDDYGQTIATAGSATVNTASVGEIEAAGDNDWFGISLQSGTTYTIDLEGSATSAGTLSDTFLHGIYNSVGELIGSTSDDDGGTGRNSQVEFTPTSSGDYYIAATGYGSNTGTYKLTVSGDDSPESAGDDYGASISTAGEVSIGGSRNGEIEITNDRDWFAVSLLAGKTYRINLEGSPTGGGTLTDSYLRGIYNSSGTLISGTNDDDSGVGLNSQLVFSPTSSGTYYISASAYGSNIGTYSVSVADTTSLPTAEAFDIAIDYNGPSQYQGLFDSAAARWMEIITGDLPDDTSANFGFIDDLLIDASVISIDGRGGVLGQAGADYVRSSSLLPVHGVMQFDSADLDSMASKGILEDVILHEMGHVLGISNWFFDNLGLLSGADYIGSNALAEYRILTGDSSLTSVPLETGGGSGTAGSHWAESVFNIELMTGYAENTPPMPISRVTIGALEDIGYTVDYSQSDSYTLNGSSSLSLPLQEEGPLREDSDQQPSGNFRAQSALATSENFEGSVFNYQDAKPLILNSGLNTEKLIGTVTSSNEAVIYFLESGTGNNHTVRIEGDFEKNSPESSLDIKGTVNTITFYSGILQAVTSLSFSESREVQSVIDDWRAAFLDGSNFIASSTDDYDDVVDAGAGNDIIQLNAGDDTLDGGTGIDTTVYTGNRSDYVITALSEGHTVLDGITSRDGLDTLTNVERLVFNDGGLALDLDGNAGDVARVLGSVVGADAIANQNFVGIGLYYLDSGMSFEEFMQLALEVTLGESPSNRAVVNMLYENIVGVTPNDQQAQEFVDLLDNNTYNATSLSVFAATSTYNDDNIDLVGLAASGVPYIEYVV